VGEDYTAAMSKLKQSPLQDTMAGDSDFAFGRFFLYFFFLAFPDGKE
jgi:hypothetical protein